MRSEDEGIRVLASLHDRGLLVPFIGAGMSMGPCTGWAGLIGNLEKAAGIGTPTLKDDLIARAEAVIQVLRRSAYDIPEVIRKAVYVAGKRDDGTHSDILARMRWPLICTTNYDDVYLRAALMRADEARRRVVPRVRGRSEHDCRGVLQHLALPTGELIWCLQGFLKPEAFEVTIGNKEKLELAHCLEANCGLDSEIVLSHSEYRGVTHRMPHFRRCFAEVFRSRSFLFLGSGLTETYFRSLFDEVVELVGPPLRPHFALVKKGTLDREFLRTHYHTILIEYDQDVKESGHPMVGRFLEHLAQIVGLQRVRAQAWGWKIPLPPATASTTPGNDDMTPEFSIVRAPLPLERNRLRAGDVVGISCGRQRKKGVPDEPMPGIKTKEVLKAELAGQRKWIDDYVVSWAGSEEWLRGIVARDPGTASSREARSPGAVYAAFERFLAHAQRCGKDVAFVQLLSAGHMKTFESWMSLVQMARAYGCWAKAQHRLGKVPMRVVVHLQGEDDVVSLMNGGFLDIAEHLEDAPMRLFIEIIDTRGNVQRQHTMVEAGKRLRDLAALRGPATPAIHALPSPRKGVEPVAFSVVADASLASLGLVSGGTLVADYRPKSIAAAEARAKVEARSEPVGSD